MVGRIDRIALRSRRAVPGTSFVPEPPAEGRAEYEMLLACLRARFDEAARDGVVAAAERTLDGERLANVARRHRLGGVVMRELRGAGLARERFADHVAGAANHVALRGLSQSSALARVLDLMESAGVTPLALKGPTLAASLYEDVGVRPSGDLDLLVPTDQLTAAGAALRRAGFRPDPDLSEKEVLAYQAAGFAHSFCDRTSGVEVELHPSLAHRAFAYAPDMSGVWSRAVPMTFAGRRVLTLAPEDLILFLCVHGAKHEWDQLIWVCDLAEAIRAHRDLDWPAIQRRAEKTGSVRMLQLGIFLAQAFAGIELPLQAAVLSAHPDVPGLARQVWSRMLDPVERSPGLLRQLRFHVGVREGRAARWAQGREKVSDWVKGLTQSARILVAPSPADEAFVALPRRLSALYWVVRPLRVVLGMRERFHSAPSAAGHENHG